MSGRQKLQCLFAPAKIDDLAQPPRKRARCLMVDAIVKSLSQMVSRSFASIMARALALTLALFALIFWLMQRALGALPPMKWDWLDTAVTLLADLGLIVSFFFLLFPVAALFVGLFLEDIAEAVEARYYAQDGVGSGPGPMAGLWIGLRFFMVVILLNMVLLPAYVLLPGLNLVLFLAINGYLIAREYFELVASRHKTAGEIKRMRKNYRFRIFGAGLVIAIPLTIPIVNLMAPLFGTAFMVHVFKDIERRADVG